jgi:putative endonuclease
MTDARPWFLYLIECRGGRYYAGISNDVERRYAAHAAGRGAKFTRAFPPLRLLATRAFPTRSAASQAEHAIRKLPKARKIEFLRAPATSPGM